MAILKLFVIFQGGSGGNFPPVHNRLYNSYFWHWLTLVVSCQSVRKDHSAVFNNRFQPCALSVARGRECGNVH